MPKLGLGLSLATPAVPSAAAPSGIVVTTTNELRVQIASLGFDDTFYNNGSGYFNGPGCGSEDNPVANNLNFENGDRWNMYLSCFGSLQIIALSTDDSIIPLTGWVNVSTGNTPVNVVFTVLS